MPGSDPSRQYANFRYTVTWDGRLVAGVSRIGGLTRATSVVSWRGGGLATPHIGPGQTDYGPLTLERGVTYDAEFEKWANKVWDYTNSGQLGQEVSLADFRRDITIALHNEVGQRVMSWTVYNTWPSSYTALPELDASANAVAIQSLTLENEGWSRNAPDPIEPDLDGPPEVLLTR